MAQLVIAAAGAVVGFFVGGPVGAQVGWAAGSLIGASFQPSQKQQGPRLTDLKVTGTDYGQTIPYCEAHPRIAGQIWWSSDRREIATTTSTGGKGGGPEIETTTYTYEVDLLVGLTDNVIAGVSRIWSNGKLIYTNWSDSSVDSREASLETDAWTRMTVYTGEADQLPDPTYEAAVGTANAPAYRGRGSVFIQGLDLGSSGQIPNLTFEICSMGVLIDEILLVHFDGTEGQTSATDECGNASGISFNGNAHIDADHPLLGGQALYLDGTGDSVGINWPVFQDFWTSNGVFTVEFMFEPDGAYPHVICHLFSALHSTCTGDFGFVISITRSDHPFPNLVVLEWKTEAGCASPASMSVPFTNDNEAHWLRFSYDGTNMNLSLDAGQETATEAATTIGGFTTGFVIGKNPAANIEFFKGWIKEIRITNDRARPSTYTFPTEEFELGDGVGSLVDEPVSDVVSRLCVRSGLAESQIDVADLSSIDREVRGMWISQITPTRNVLEMLMSVYMFDATLSDKIYFIARGGDSVVTIPYEDLGASDRDDANVEPLALRQSNDIEIPAQVALTYANFLYDYQTDTQLSDRIISAADQSVASVTVPLVMIPSEAKIVADVMSLDQAASMVSTDVNLLGDYSAYEPTDVITTEDKDGNPYRLRLVQRKDSYPLLAFKAVMDNAEVLVSEGTTDDDYDQQVEVEAPADTIMELMDIPILRDADDDPGHYVATRGSGTTYPGSAIYKSIDDIDYDLLERITESAVLGDCDTVLGDWTGARVFDEINSVTVDVGNGTLTSRTRDTILSSTSNAMLIGSEIIQFLNAELIDTGVYKLTSLLRGCRGTEWAMTGHSSNERCVLLRTAGLRRIDMESAELGMTRYYAGVTLGRRLSTALTGSPEGGEPFTNTGIGLKPFSLVDVRTSRNVMTGDITITAQRRSRLGVRMIGSMGINVPLGEDSASFEADIYAAGSPTTAVRTLTGSLSGTLVTFTYTNSDQQTDFGSPTPSQFSGAAYQLSATVGRGYAASFNG